MISDHLWCSSRLEVLLNWEGIASLRGTQVEEMSVVITHFISYRLADLNRTMNSVRSQVAEDARGVWPIGGGDIKGGKKGDILKLVRTFCIHACTHYIHSHVHVYVEIICIPLLIA